MPKVSICIPTYNDPIGFKRALSSIEKQKFTNYEVVISDDSTDLSIKKIVAKSRIKKKIIYSKNKVRLGSPENFNQAIRKSTGEYIKILLHDDWFTSGNSLLQFVKLLEKDSKIDFAFSGSADYNVKLKRTFNRNASNYEIHKLRLCPEYLFGNNFIGSPSTTIFRRSVDVYFDKNIKWVVDLEFYIRVLNKNPRFNYTSNPLVSLTTQTPSQISSQFQDNFCKELFEYSYVYRKLNPRKLSEIFYLKVFWQLFKHYNINSYSQWRSPQLMRIASWHAWVITLFRTIGLRFL